MCRARQGEEMLLIAVYGSGESRSFDILVIISEERSNAGG